MYQDSKRAQTAIFLLIKRGDVLVGVAVVSQSSLISDYRNKNRNFTMGCGESHPTVKFPLSHIPLPAWKTVRQAPLFWSTSPFGHQRGKGNREGQWKAMYLTWNESRKVAQNHPRWGETIMALCFLWHDKDWWYDDSMKALHMMYKCV